MRQQGKSVAHQGCRKGYCPPWGRGCPLLVWLLLVVSAVSVQAGQRVTDLTGRTVDLPETINRVISLAPSITEMVFLLGRGDTLVGATQFSTHPPAAAKLPRVGSYVRLDVERIVGLRPDLCLATRDGNPRQIVDRLTGLGVAVYAIDPRDIEHIKQSTLALGRLLDATDRAREVVAEMDRRLAAVARHLGQIADRPRVFFQIDMAPMVSAGRDSFVDPLIRLAGGDNAVGGQTGYPRYNWEEVIALAPEVVIITSMAGGQTPAELRAMWMRWPQIPAVRDGRLYVIDADLFDRPTPRLVEGVEQLARVIHPECWQGAP